MGNSAIASASNIQMDYMKLLSTQLRNQNPLEPMNNSDMASQLAQFSQLAQTEKLNANFEKVLSNAQLGYASSLLGRDVTFAVEDELGEQQVVTGKVDKASGGSGAEVLLGVGNHQISLDEIISVQ